MMGAKQALREKFADNCILFNKATSSDARKMKEIIKNGYCNASYQ
jgi:hypothetical protein